MLHLRLEHLSLLLFDLYFAHWRLRSLSIQHFVLQRLFVATSHKYMIDLVLNFVCLQIRATVSVHLLSFQLWSWGSSRSYSHFVWHALLSLSFIHFLLLSETGFIWIVYLAHLDIILCNLLVNKIESILTTRTVRFLLLKPLTLVQLLVWGFWDWCVL